MIRYVLSPQQQVLVDYRQRLPGRGAYTCCNSECINRAAEKNLLARGLKANIAPQDKEQVVGAVLNAMVQRVESLLGMARKSGQIMSGGQAVLANLRAGEDVAFVLLSTDISSGIADKLLHAAESRRVEVFQLLEKGRIGKILGKGERSVAAVLKGHLANAIMFEMQRFKRMSREN